jgi:creatinine amidohydrolase
MLLMGQKMAIDVAAGVTSVEFDHMIRKYTRALVPVGSLEQHGMHLPVATDLIIAEYITKHVAERVHSFVFPTVSYGISFEHAPLFNVSLRYSTLINLTNDISLSLSRMGLKKVIYINGHHGNSGALQYVMHYFADGRITKDFSVYSLNYWNMMDAEFDHGGDTETSIMLAIRSDLVRMDKAEPSAIDRPKLKRTYQMLTNNPSSFPKLTGNGVWGDPRNATAGKGQELLEQIIENTKQVILELEDL